MCILENANVMFCQPVHKPQCGVVRPVVCAAKNLSPHYNSALGENSSDNEEELCWS